MSTTDNFSTETSFSGSVLHPLGTASAPTLPELGFVERRESAKDVVHDERRQFASSYHDLSPDARELAVAIDKYKIDNRRRYITCEEMLAVVKQLGYLRHAEAV